jgi:hypothetical protein
MSRIGTRTATIAAAAGGLFTALVALSPTAAADPAAAPGLPGIDVVQQLANAPAIASQFLQSAASILAPKPAATPAAPASSAPPAAPTASASLNLPQNPLAQNPLTQNPLTQNPISAPMNSLVGTVPPGQVNLPASIPVAPLLSQLGLPANLSGLGIPNLGATPGAPATAPAAPLAPVQPALAPDLNPFSALP